MPNAEELVESWFQAHFSHITPGTPDHFMVTRAKEDLLARLAALPKKQSSKPEQPKS